MLEAPQMTGRSCEMCKQWMYADTGDRLSGRIQKDAVGNPMRRPKLAPTPCGICPKIDRDSLPTGATPAPKYATEITHRTAAALWYYRQCQADATGILPRDRLTVQNNAQIQAVYESHDRSIAQENNELLKVMLHVRA